MATSSFAGKSKDEIIAIAERAKARAQKMEESSEETMHVALSAVEVGATAFGFGYMRGKYADAAGKWEIFGLPPDLLAAVALHGVAILGWGDKYESHLHNVANGALASYAVTLGVGMGAAHAAAGSKGGIGVQGLPPRRIHPSAAVAGMRYARAA